ncbi:alpha/beta hydrolase [Paenibacillus xylanexedens]|uniref:alpha/beta hydrolase n=1 Tax=Paenibacillus xylanexedens TaxID=528191 RepID=UPI0011AA3585|nr:alpha/beta hydrolase [Paenibacillus xylanexedens]
MDIYDYRAGKERMFSEIIQFEKKNGKAEKQSVRTSVGYIDFYIYRPKNHQNRELPMFINLHGGGFVLGYCEQDGKYCQMLADIAGCAVVNIDYCLAPENKFPAAIESTYEVVKYLEQNGNNYMLNPKKIVIGGHSAGGNISAALVLMSIKNQENLFSGLILDYALLDFAKIEKNIIDSAKAMSNERLQQYMDWYLTDDQDKFNELASPLLAKDVSAFPPTLVISAYYDSFREEEEEFAEKLKNFNVPVEYYCFDGCSHGFTHDIFSEYNAVMSQRAWDAMGMFLSKRFNG